MPVKWRETLKTVLSSLREFALTVAAFGGVQVLLALIIWPLIFGDDPLGLSLALSLVGFASWGIAFAASLGGRGRQSLTAITGQTMSPPVSDRNLLANMQDQVTRSGCGCILLTSSLIPLAIAFVLRLQADLRTGLDLGDIFPPMP